MIQVDALRKAYGRAPALHGISFTAQAGQVTGLVGPNGAGKSTAMRIIAGQERADSGRATVDGKPLAQHRDPLRRIGIFLDSPSAHPGRTPRNHLTALAATHGIRRERVSRVIEEVGLESVEDRRIGTFSKGMRQRLGVASALLGDPANLILDEPVNGLDPDGALWLRRLCRRMASDGRAVLVSSHLMRELELTVDRVVILGRGRVLADTSLESLASAHTVGVRVLTPDAERLFTALHESGIDVERFGAFEVQASGMSAAEVGDLAWTLSIRIHELVTLTQDLETVYLGLTSDAAQYRSAELA